MISRIPSETLNIFTSYCLYFRPEQPCGQWIPGLFPRDKVPSSLEVKESLEIYLHSASEPSEPVNRANFTSLAAASIFRITELFLPCRWS